MSDTHLPAALSYLKLTPAPSTSIPAPSAAAPFAAPLAIVTKFIGYFKVYAVNVG